MGLMIRSLCELPPDVTGYARAFYVYLLDYGWKEKLASEMYRQFLRMAEVAAKHDAVVIRGTVGHFADEVLSWHHVNGADAKDLLPGILVTTKDPRSFREGNWGADEHRDRLLLIPLREACASPDDVAPLIDRLFSDIRQGRRLSQFDIAKRMTAGRRGAVLDAIVLSPTSDGSRGGLELREVADFLGDEDSVVPTAKRPVNRIGGSGADILLVTATKVETVAVLEAFGIVEPSECVRNVEGRTYFNLGTINGTRINLTQSEMGAGGLGASQQTVQKGIAALSPRAVIMVGIAFGMNEKRQRIGDVLVSERLRPYDLQRVGTGRNGAQEIILRDDKPHASSPLLNLFRSSEVSWKGATLRFGTVLTGEKLVDSLDFRAQLRALEPEAVGGEMEGAGLYVACHDKKVDWILAKSICDFADGQKGRNKGRRQTLAAKNAAMFVHHALRFVRLDWGAGDGTVPVAPRTPLAEQRDHSLAPELERYGASSSTHETQPSRMAVANADDVDFADEIAAFRDLYLGTRENPVPFGGRTDELNRLDNWLVDARAPRYRVMVAPPAQGKSALLVRWVERLAGRRDLAVLFFPISTRLGTNHEERALQALARGLAGLFRERMEPGMRMLVRDARASIRRYLEKPLPDGRRLIVVLDGLDEAVEWATPWTLFPQGLFSTHRVLLSTLPFEVGGSAEAILSRFGLERPGIAALHELPRLTLGGVEEVLRSAGARLSLTPPEYARLAHALQHLANGDPLVVGLYVDMLGRGEVNRVPELTDGTTGLAAALAEYFRRWWANQRKLWRDRSPLRETATKAVLGVLAGGLGPLSRSDLLALTSTGGDAFPASDLDEILQPLGRLVIHGGPRSGYSFGHPLLGRYFRETQMRPDEQQAYDERFLTWGRQVLAQLEAGTLDVRAVPPYLVRHYGEHLERAGVGPELFLPLSGLAWQRVWEVTEGSYAGFLRDVERGHRTAQREDEIRTGRGEPAAFLAQAIRAVLLRASINHLDDSLSPALLRALVEEGIWTFERAFTHALRALGRPTGRELVTALVTVVPSAERDRVLNAILALDNESERTQLLCAFAPVLDGPRLDSALTAARSLQDAASRVGVLGALAVAAPVRKRRVLLEEALTTARSIRVRRARVQALLPLLPQLSASMRREALEEVVAEAARAARSTRRRGRLLPDLDAIAMVRSLGVLAHLLPESLRDTALDVVLALPDENLREEVLAPFAPHLSRTQVRRALNTLSAIADPAGRARGLAALIKGSESAPVKVAFRAAANEFLALEKDYAWAMTVPVVAPYLPGARRRMALNAAVAVANAIGDDSWARIVLIALAPQLVGEASETALNRVAAMTDVVHRVAALKAVAPRLPRERAERVREVAQTTQDGYFRVAALCAVAPALPTDAQREVLEAALSLAKGIGEGDRYWALRDLARILPDDLKQRAFECAQALADRDSRRELLNELAPKFPTAARARALREALTARGIGDAAVAAETLRALSTVSETLGELQQVLDQRRRTSDRPQRTPSLGAPPYMDPAFIESRPLEATDQVLEFNGADPLLFHLGFLIPCLSRLPRQELFPVWTRVLKKLEQLNREECLIGLGELAPIIEALGGQVACDAVINEIQDILKRWP